MKSKLLFFIIFLLLFANTISNSCYAKLISSIGNGLWTAPGTWSPAGPPVNGDEIVITAGNTVTIFGTVNLNNVTIAVRGTLIIVGTLRLNSNSTVIIENGGNITGIGQIILGGTTTITFFPPIGGPQYIADPGGLQIGLPPGYVPLPIQLITFNASISGEAIQISWATATELNNDFFTIERSEDGLNWSAIGEMAGAGNSTVRIDYEFYDIMPIPGILYYRLKQTDYDGQYEYFRAVVIRYEPENLFRVYPNPSTGPLTIITSGELNNAHIIMYDASGKSVAIPVSTNRYQAFLDISGLGSGVYILEIVYPQSRLSQRIIKQ